MHLDPRDNSNGADLGATTIVSPLRSIPRERQAWRIGVPAHGGPGFPAGDPFTPQRDLGPRNRPSPPM